MSSYKFRDKPLTDERRLWRWWYDQEKRHSGDNPWDGLPPIRHGHPEAEGTRV